MRNSQKGFTLIELLVVIAIIGILATIVLTSLGSARSKANDAKVQAQLSSMRAQAELFYATNSHYGTAGDCSSGSLFTTGASGNGLDDLLSAIPSGYVVACYTNPSSSSSAVAAWAVTAENPDGTAAWCVDSTGQSTAATSSITATGAVCP